MEDTRNRTLPRGPHADRPRADEKVRRQGGADLQNGWLGRHGTLYITDERLVFVPTPLDTLLRAKRREMRLDDITVVERWPLSPGGIPRGGKRPRLLIHTPQCVYELMVGDLDGWFDAIEKVYHLRRVHTPDAHMPEFRREGVENLMMAED